MMRYCIVLVAMLFLVSCKKEATAKAATTKKDSVAACGKPAGKDFKMYHMSEMASLMEQMYTENQMLKQRIIAGDTVGTFPQHIVKIHSAAMTDVTDNDAFFKAQAAKFIKAQELIYKDPKNARTHFNDAVSSCIQCHQGKCEGPIPRIKKLYIK